MRIVILFLIILFPLATACHHQITPVAIETLSREEVEQRIALLETDQESLLRRAHLAEEGATGSYHADPSAMRRAQEQADEFRVTANARKLEIIELRERLEELSDDF